MSVGGEVGVAKGKSEVRLEARATMMAAGGGSKAARTSEAEEGEPVVMVRPGVGVGEEEERTRAVMVCERESASAIMSWPVRPEPPIMRMCILKELVLFKCCCDCCRRVGICWETLCS